MTTETRGKRRLIFLLAEGMPNPWDKLGTETPAGFETNICPLTKIHEFETSKAGEEVHALLLDLDDLAQTKPLDNWALSAWRATFNELVMKCMPKDGRPPLLLAYTREPTWDRAVLALRAGARDLVRLSRLGEHLRELFEPDSTQSKALVFSDVATNVIPFAKSDIAEESVRSTVPAAIPKHAIPFPIEGLEGNSNAIEVVRNVVRKSAALDTSVLISGPTGSGKELVARSLHRYSPRANGPFIPVNCGAISPGLVEVELFGHAEGAYTGSNGERVGYLEAANGGTLFLDEVSELPVEMQVKLLRALQERTITPVGGQKQVPIDIRVVSASKEDLNELCAQKKFREDLLYRLRVMEITLPSLVERKSDLAEISQTLLKRFARRHRKNALQLDAQAFDKFLMYRWPGNIRELENALEHGATLAWAENRSEIQVRDLPETLQFASAEAASEGELKEIVRRFEKEYIASTVRRMGGSKEQAADVLGLSLATLYRKLGNGAA